MRADRAAMGKNYSRRVRFIKVIGAGSLVACFVGNLSFVGFMTWFWFDKTE